MPFSQLQNRTVKLEIRRHKRQSKKTQQQQKTKKDQKTKQKKNHIEYAIKA